jgi:hypothetical protein
MKEFEYDVAIIGSGLAGCLAARILAKNGCSRIVIIESEPEFGGLTRGLAKGSGLCDFGLKQIPFAPGSEINIQEFSQILSELLGVALEEQVQPLVTFGKSGDSYDFQPFVGFGEKTPPAREVLDYYIHSKVLVPNTPIHTWPTLLIEDLQGKLLTRSNVTKIEVENENITAIIVNGDKKLHVKRVIYAGHPLGLERLLPTSVLPAKTRQRFSKTRFWTSVDLELKHKINLQAKTGLHVLVGPGDEPRVVLGVVHEDSELKQHSHWLTFVPSDEADEESAATALREMKKLMQKAYPTILDSKIEKVLVTPKSHGSLGGKNESDFSMSGVKNLHMTSSMLEPSPNIIGTVLRSHSVTLTALRELRRHSERVIESNLELT